MCSADTTVWYFFKKKLLIQKATQKKRAIVNDAHWNIQMKTSTFVG